VHRRYNALLACKTQFVETPYMSPNTLCAPHNGTVVLNYLIRGISGGNAAAGEVAAVGHTVVVISVDDPNPNLDPEHTEAPDPQSYAWRGGAYAVDSRLLRVVTLRARPTDSGRRCAACFRLSDDLRTYKCCRLHTACAALCYIIHSKCPCGSELDTSRSRSKKYDAKGKVNG
jgi:hypothetical protein